ncbi:uncharacterized protein LOC34618929 [Cyclospora cayetanensis]|uniref:Uncharacterized protein n=2 Tax=Cyclospora cayetanensis TaxID=88456 RepID=A0A1D3CW89_9EIME|nr:uncharacterized protein LOC34618929 [Cyclospora cayetanensis]OEH75465.1 hypothetical protein cyc_02019 [Cyclospora cayetanensis]
MRSHSHTSCCGRLHRFGASSELDSESSAVDAAIAALRAAAHNALGRRKKVPRKVAAVQCDLEPKAEEAAEEPAESSPSTVQGKLNIRGNVLLATDWDLIDDDVRFAHYPLLSLDCCGADQQRQQKYWDQQLKRSLPRPLLRLQQRPDDREPRQLQQKLQQKLRRELQHQQLQRIPKHREAFPVRPNDVNPEADDYLKNRVRQTYDHAHSLPLHINDDYLKLHAKLNLRRRKPTPGRYGPSRRCCSPAGARPLSVGVPVCTCPRVFPGRSNGGDRSVSCQRGLWKARQPSTDGVSNTMQPLREGVPVVAGGGTPPNMHCGAAPLGMSSLPPPPQAFCGAFHPGSAPVGSLPTEAGCFPLPPLQSGMIF